MFDSVEDVEKKLHDQEYICGKNIATVVYLASKLRKPILIEGPAGVGKTELGRAVSRALQMPLIRLQCYEGLDESKALYEWEYSKQLLYTQMLRDKIEQVIGDADTLQDAAARIGEQDDVFFSDRFIVPRPLLRGILSEEPVALLIDEVDKSDPEFEAFLLEVLSDYTVSIPEIGTMEARHIPLVFLTSNDSREMTDALKRRCLHLWIDFPGEEQELAIVNLKVQGIQQRLAEEIVQLIQSIRKLDLKKSPSISETLDWARALMVLNADSLDAPLVEETLNIILKYEGDIHKAQTELSKLLKDKNPAVPEPEGGEKPAAEPAPPNPKKSVLH